MNRWGKEESLSSPPTRSIAGRIWASSICWPTRFCTSMIFRSREGSALEEGGGLAFVGGALEFPVAALFGDSNRPQIFRMDQADRPGRSEVLVSPVDRAFEG